MRVFPDLLMTERRPNAFHRSPNPIIFNRRGTQLLKKKDAEVQGGERDGGPGRHQFDEFELEALNAELGSFDGALAARLPMGTWATEQDCDIDG
eukprot:6700884-Pyramimonas_sp.AAC.1